MLSDGPSPARYQARKATSRFVHDGPHTMTSSSVVRFDRRPRLGLSIVELMVGITIGLFILAGASMVLTTQLGDNRRLLLEVQVQQDLRSAADIISRELRGAGYWSNATNQVWQSTLTNPYSADPLVATSNNSSLVYYKSLENPGFDNNLIDNNEYGGFRLNSNTGTIDMQLGNGNWQPLTDPAVLIVRQFTLVPNTVGVDVPPSVPGGAILKLCVRDVTMTIVVRAAHDAAVQRSISNRIRLRNDVVKASCP